MLSRNNQYNTLSREESDPSRIDTDSKQNFEQFAISFVRKFEDELSKSKKVLEEHPISVEPNTVTKVSSAILSLIPRAGKPASNAAKQIGKWKHQRDEKKKASELREIIMFSTERRKDCRSILIRAAMEIFYVQYQQFSIVTTKYGQWKAMQKIGFDAAFRLISYLQNNTAIDTLTINIVMKGVINGKGKGRRLIANKKKISTTDFFENIGFCVEVRSIPTCFNHNKNIRELGHRTLFSWEDISNLTVNYNLTPTPCVYTRNVNTDEFDEYIEQAREYIESEIPYVGRQKDNKVKGSMEKTIRKRVSTNEVNKEEEKLEQLDVNNNHSLGKKDSRVTFKHPKQYKRSTTLLPINRKNFFIINTVVFILLMYFYYNELFKVD